MRHMYSDFWDFVDSRDVRSLIWLFGTGTAIIAAIIAARVIIGGIKCHT